MLIRLQSPTPSMMAEAFRLAAQYGYAIDITKDFGAITTHEPKASRPVKADKPRIETAKASPKPQPKAVKAVKTAKPKAAKAPRETESVPETAESIAFTELRKKGSALRTLAESGAFRLTPKVYGDLRSKDISKLEAAVRIADGVASAAPEAKPAKAARKLHPSRRIPLSERVKLTESTPSPEEMEMSAEHIEAELHKALLADLPLLEEEMDEDEMDEETDEVEELDFDHA